jgi:nitrate/TMAO reductase-like tetraheme cytochrome c subunit
LLSTSGRLPASKEEVWGKIFGTIDTREKFVAMRLELAQHEWARLKANNSLKCRNCHEFDYMDFTDRASGLPMRTPLRSPAGKRPALTAIKASPPNCPI